MIGGFCKCLRPLHLKKYFRKLARNESTTTWKPSSSSSEKFDFDLSEDVEEDYDQRKISSKRQPGLLHMPCIQLPQTLIEAVLTAKEEFGYHKHTLDKDARELRSYIYSRHLPQEKGEMEETMEVVTAKLVNKGMLTPKFLEENSASLEDMTKDEKSRFIKSLKSHVYNWHPLNFDDYGAFIYLWGRLAPDYAVLVRIFNEIKKRCKDFSPSSLFDFGSGVGSVTWAADFTWPEAIKEVFNVDASGSMNQLAERLLKGGHEDGILPKRNNTTYFRQFLPTSEGIKFDLVVCSRTLFEIGDLKTRAKTADILWKKVVPGGFLVFVEAGTFRGYSSILEVRDYLLEICRVQKNKYGIHSPIHVFAPCTHDEFCPRYYHRSKSSCHFSVNYSPLSFSNVKSDVFSYVILQKEDRNEEERKWPRIVEPVLRKHKHVITRTCTPAGAIREFVVTKKKHGPSCYQLCKKCNWGDFLPIRIHNDVAEDNEVSTGDSKETSGDRDSEETSSNRDSEERSSY